jgi:hypothetical protein
MKSFYGFFKKEKTLIEKGSAYGVLRGDYRGEIFVFFKQENDVLFFVSMPKMELRKVDIAKFHIGVNEKILDFINILPKNIYKVVEAHGKNILNA